MDLPIFRDEGSGEGRQRVEMARRLSVVRWFSPERHHGQIGRLAFALKEAARLGGRKSPSQVQILDAREGWAWLREAEPSLWIGSSAADWLERMAEQHAANAALRAALNSLGFVEFQGEALVLLPGCLPIDQAILWERLQISERMYGRAGSEEGGDSRPALLPLERSPHLNSPVRTPSPARRATHSRGQSFTPRHAVDRDSEPAAKGRLTALIDRILHDCGGLLVAAALGLPPEENPFVPQLQVFEEGLFPLDLDSEVPVLWLPNTVRNP